MFINIIIAAGFHDSEDSISTVQALQDCGSSVPFMSQCGLSQDPSSGIIHIKLFNNGGCRYTNKCWVVGNKVLWDIIKGVMDMVAIVDLFILWLICWIK